MGAPSCPSSSEDLAAAFVSSIVGGPKPNRFAVAFEWVCPLCPLCPLCPPHSVRAVAASVPLPHAQAIRATSAIAGEDSRRDSGGR